MKSRPTLTRALWRSLAVVPCSMIITFSALNYAAPRAIAHKESCTAGDARDAALFREVLAAIEQEYVNTPDRSRLVQSALQAMASTLDSHSAYLETSELEDSELADTGTYCGVGIELDIVGPAVEMVNVIAGSPAARAGLQPGDTVIAVDGQPVGRRKEYATHLLEGRPGTKVYLIIRHRSSAFRPYALRRRCFPIRTVSAALLESGYGYVRISSFNDTTPTELKQAIDGLNRMNRARLRGFVLDLRENGGGVLEDGAAVADAFLDRGVIVTTDGRTPQSRMRFNATPGDILHGVPMAVLVNEDTASASEIVAGALRDHARATLVGTRTYGKGTVQSIIPLSKGAIELTTARFFTPSGASVHGQGIVPDVLIDGTAPASDSSAADADPSERDPEVSVALKVVKQRANLPGHPTNSPLMNP